METIGDVLHVFDLASATEARVKGGRKSCRAVSNPVKAENWRHRAVFVRLWPGASLRFREPVGSGERSRRRTLRTSNFHPDDTVWNLQSELILFSGAPVM